MKMMAQRDSTTNLSIWLGKRPRDGVETLQVIESLWPDFGDETSWMKRSVGNGGRIFRLVGAGDEFNTGWLQKFANNLAGELAYQCVEIFVSPPSFANDGPATAIFVAGAYRIGDLHGPPTNRAESRPQGVYPITHSFNGVERLRRLLLSGEAAADVRRRMDLYSTRSAQTQDEADMIAYIDYAAAATIAASLAGIGPAEHEGPVPVLWDYLHGVLSSLSKSSMSITAGVKTAFGYIIQSLGSASGRMDQGSTHLLLEADESTGEVIRGAKARAKLARGNSPSNSDFVRALALWHQISDYTEELGRTLSAHVWDLPSSVIRLLFEAHARSYPLWLQSATLLAEKRLRPTLHNCLRDRIAQSRGARNQTVDVITLLAYEKAVQRLLKPHRKWPLATGKLISMLTIPFWVHDVPGRGETMGFVRFMNRFHTDQSGSCVHWRYRTTETNDPWYLEREERWLAEALRPVIESRLAALWLFGRRDSPTDKRHRLVAVPGERAPQTADRPVDPGSDWPSIIGRSEATRTLLRKISQVAPRRMSVLVEGENGVGKELVARALHDRSDRQDRPFIACHLKAIPPGMQLSELFGHVKGSFTNAFNSRVGVFERASGGTLFLDEIGEWSPESQVYLLRVLETGVIHRVGSNDPIAVDVRVVTATNRSLLDEVDSGRFREDLYYRINQFRIHVPPLRERRDDIPTLVDHFLDQFVTDGTLTRRPRYSPDFIAGLQQRNWRGNIRELKNVVRESAVWDSAYLDASCLPEEQPHRVRVSAR